MNAGDLELTAGPSFTPSTSEIGLVNDERPWIGYEAAFPGSWSCQTDMRNEVAAE